MQDSVKPENWYSVKEVAGKLGWSEDTIRRLIYRGRLKALVLHQSSKAKRVYRPARIRGADVLGFLERSMN